MKLLVATEFACDAPGGGPAVVRQMLEGFASEGGKGNAIFWWGVRRPAAGQRSLAVQTSFAPPFLGKLYPTRRFTHLKAGLLERFWAPLAAGHLRKTIRTVKPDGIWVIPHDWSIPPLGLALCGNGNLPRFHTTIQDYPDAHGHPAQWGAEVCARLNRRQNDLYRLAASRDATSLPMLADLEARTGARGIRMLHQGLEPADFAHLENPAIRNPQPAIVKIAYAGSILVMKEFEFFVEVLSALRSTIRTELHFYGAHSHASRAWFRNDWMVEHGNLPERQLVEELRSCDWGFIPMSLDDSDPRYNRYSFPTKFITYLAAGLPVITLGHPECSVMKMARTFPVGVTLESGDARDAVARLGGLADPAAPRKFRAGILRCARENFDAVAMRARLWQCFSSLAKGRP
ncbi:MAG: hypothetical protein ACOYM3_25300 [Terrimicrobiaceae bacterium]